MPPKLIDQTKRKIAVAVCLTADEAQASTDLAQQFGVSRSKLFWAMVQTVTNDPAAREKVASQLAVNREVKEEEA